MVVGLKVYLKFSVIAKPGRDMWERSMPSVSKSGSSCYNTDPKFIEYKFFNLTANIGGLWTLRVKSSL